MADWVRIVGWVVGVAVLITVLYFLYTGLSSEYDDTLSKEPWLVETTKTANRQTIVPGKKILRSDDGRFGIEFSYSFWMYISEWQGGKDCGPRSGDHHILHKGDALANPLQAPGIWLASNQNKLIVRMNTFAERLEFCQVPNIPVHKWVHVSVVVINRNVDIYINGFLKKRCLLAGLPRQNDGDVYINAFGGFDGFLSRVRYFSYALPIWKIEAIISQGPSSAPCIETGETPPYLAQDYWQTRRFPVDSKFPSPSG